MAQLLGRDAPLYVLAQAASGVAASGDYNPITYYSLDPGFSQSEDDDSRIGAALHNAVDRQAPVLGQIDLSPNFTIPFCLANIGFWLPHFFKVTAPTGSGPYTHIFTSGATDHAGASLVWVDGEKYKIILSIRPHRKETTGSPLGQKHCFAYKRLLLGFSNKSD